MHRQLRVVLFLLISAIAFTSPLLAQADPGIPDTVRVDSVTAYPSGKGVIPIYLYNDEIISAIEISLIEHSQQAIIDSVSFVGGRVSSWSPKGGIHDGDSIMTIFAQTLGALLPVGNGLIATLYVSYAPDILPQDIPFDSITYIVTGGIERSVSLTGVNPQAFKPKFRRGHLTILEAPVALDSIWVDTVKTSVGANTIVDVNMFNERNVQSVAIALTYGSSYLTFDSASFIDTRGISATTRTVNRNDAGHEMLLSLDFLAPLAPGTGKIARLFFKVSPTAPDTIIAIDTTKYFGIFGTKTTLTELDGNAEFTPFFRAGWVDISTTTDVDDHPDDNLPKVYSLAQNYPNPFNPSTTIEFSLPVGGKVQLDVFNTLGQRVKTLLSDELSAGTHRIVFDGRSNSGNELATGIYFYRLSSGSFTQTKKMLLVK